MIASVPYVPHDVRHEPHSQGANSYVPTVALRVAVRHAPHSAAPRVEAAALLLDANGTARTGADVVFQARPVHPSAAVRHAGDPHDDGAQWLELDLPHIEAEIEPVLVVCSTDSGTVGDLAQPTVEAFAPNGVSVVRYTVTDATTETAFVFGEFYRRAGGWKFRAVGQGYASGLAGLTSDYSIEVTAAPAPPAPAPPAPAPPHPHRPHPHRPHPHRPHPHRPHSLRPRPRRLPHRPRFLRLRRRRGPFCSRGCPRPVTRLPSRRSRPCPPPARARRPSRRTTRIRIRTPPAGGPSGRPSSPTPSRARAGRSSPPTTVSHPVPSWSR
ncbi:TerD family protein [Streptomyces sp. NPDC060020]|uniref:TerD family protein n=1 Tax=Streptomyces sp. NPDC060020 TaxID=3347038 RepID=UPI0036B1EBCA